MPLTYHKTVDAPAAFTALSAQATKSTLNSNFNICEANEQDVEDAFEDTLHDLCGDGIMSGMAATYGASLQITIAAGYAIIGRIIPYAGGTVTALDDTSGYIYFAQDGGFTVVATATPPAGKSSFLYATFVAAGGIVTSVTLQNQLILPQLKVITDTFAEVPVPDAYNDFQVDHSTLGAIYVQGYLDLQLTHPESFSIDQLYPQVLSDESDVDSALHNTTPTSFWVRLSRLSGYSYAGDPSVGFTWIRYGLGYG